MNNLDPHHAESLRQSAITEAVIAARGYRTVTDANELTRLGFAPAQRRVPGLLLPLWTAEGKNGVYVYRPDNPRVAEDKRKKNPDGTHPNKVIKYEYPKGESMRLDCPPPCQTRLGDPAVPLWITEGQKKADSLASAGLCAIALLGVWNFIGKNQHGGKVWLPDWDYIALNDREVRIIFDSDMMRKSEVEAALKRLREHLQRRGARVNAAYLPHSPNGDKWGVDDWLAAGHTRDELAALVEAPRPAPQAAPPTIELLDAAPAMMRRPLALIAGKAYAATWLYTKVTIKESLSRKGEVVRHDPPIARTESRLFVIRDDGTIFGDSGDKPMSEAGLEVHLPESPFPDKLWSAAGVKAYKTGARPALVDVFGRMVAVVDRFIDFDRSLADQSTMAEAVACYCLSTWLLDAFSVIGFLWPNGDRGSGKTHLLLTVAELSYLGQVILAGGSFASLRDLADYGATLAFDDAENLSDSKTDPDKRALLLAGNRRGATVTLKELGPDKTWRTRHVNAFCPRLFSAIRLPDSVLASRTIIIPLIRTPDRKRANADPLDYSAWPHDRRRLIDDLWALGLTHLPNLSAWDQWVGQNAPLTGRNLQPWRALLAVAAWLDANGVPGLRQRMEKLSTDYQNERPELETSDFTVLVIRALLDCVVANVTNVANVANEKEATPKVWEWTTAQVAEAAAQIAKDSEGDIDPERLNSQRVGHILRKMRLTKPPRPRGQKARIWRVTADELIRWAMAYGLPVPDELAHAIPSQDTSPGIGNIGVIGDIGNADDSDLWKGEL